MNKTTKTKQKRKSVPKTKMPYPKKVKPKKITAKRKY